MVAKVERVEKVENDLVSDVHEDIAALNEDLEDLEDIRSYQ